MTAPRSKATKAAAPSTGTRPSLGRKVTPKSEKTREEALNRGVAIVLDEDGREVRYEVRIGDVTSTLAAQLRANAGIGPLQLISAMVTSPDIDLIAAFVWLARRVRGEAVVFTDVQVTYGQMLGEGFTMDLPDGSDDSPET